MSEVDVFFLCDQQFLHQLCYLQKPTLNE